MWCRTVGRAIVVAVVIWLSSTVVSGTGTALLLVLISGSRSSTMGDKVMLPLMLLLGRSVVELLAPSIRKAPGQESSRDNGVPLPSKGIRRDDCHELGI